MIKQSLWLLDAKKKKLDKSDGQGHNSCPDEFFVGEKNTGFYDCMACSFISPCLGPSSNIARDKLRLKLCQAQVRLRLGLGLGLRSGLRSGLSLG